MWIYGGSFACKKPIIELHNSIGDKTRNKLPDRCEQSTQTLMTDLGLLFYADLLGFLSGYAQFHEPVVHFDAQSFS